MEIVWYGHSCFRITERGMGSVVTDPFDSAVAGYSPLKLKAEIVTISCDDPAHNFSKAVKGDPLVISGPGEYEVGGVFITGMRTASDKKDADGLRNTLYIMDFGTLTVAHLGRVSHTPTQSDIESMGSVNIALVPVGDGASLNASKAAEVISMLEPNIVIPMYYDTPQSKLNLDPLSKFLKEMGITQLETLESYKITNANAFTEEETHVIALDPKIMS
ncbi:MAG: MBL fold metallo-hydrolase [Chloroflexi bacterium]|jgi:L-ascorbate metabolism protein UlaG (beta-lactamase superfamily)|nr:MBL fold metallo-hydrolase [Anaerolineaceae bacterium]NLI43958.1 MBL fold metallo-hydrolase [Chloroflexota bacterium]HOE35527.1 MBL fold metallo-hydrolase [Anaerolineaceae bacterium]HOT26174.1 MBL fold metallo-hydrolase [Anaerolineaceae bacterium]HQK03610.1 MBL fold metallo-hydrolase [Anaerolineaceae bacterium]